MGSNLLQTIDENVFLFVNGLYTPFFDSFPSCHAANTAALAMFLSLYYRQKWFTLIMVVWAMLVCYSRMYLGVHYPGDIMAGIAVGSIYAYLFYRVEQMAEKRLTTGPLHTVKATEST